MPQQLASAVAKAQKGAAARASDGGPRAWGEKYGKRWKNMEKCTRTPLYFIIFHDISWENYGKLRRKMKEHWKIEGGKN